MSRTTRTFLVLVLFAIGTSLITPLIPIYKRELGFSDTVVTLFLVCYVIALVPSMLTLGQLSDRVGRKPVLAAAIATLALAQVVLITQPQLWAILIARALQGAATGAFFGTCTAFLVEQTRPARRGQVATLSSVSVRGGLALGPGLGGLFAEYLPEPLRLPFAVHLGGLAIALVILWALPETVTPGPRRPLKLRLEVPAAERAVFWRVLVPSGMLFSLFDGVCLAIVPVFEVQDLGVTNYALVGAAGFLVLMSGAISQLVFRHLAPTPAIGWGLVIACVCFVGVVVGAPLHSATIVLSAVTLTGAACGLVFKGGIDLATRIAPPADRGKLISSYYVACYLGGFSLPLLIVGILADIMGRTLALGVLVAAAAVATAWTWFVGLRALDRLSPHASRLHA
jgi:MFS family permease